MTATPPPIPRSARQSLPRVLLKFGFVFASLLPSFLMLGRHADFASPVGFIAAGVLSFGCGFGILHGENLSKLAYIVCSTILGIGIFGVNLAVGIFLGCLSAVSKI
jgi:hypothetical protein